MNNHRSNAKPCFDPFTAKAGALVLVVCAAGFLLLSLHALVTGCIQVRQGLHGPGVAYCKPQTVYWVASITLFVLGCGLAVLFIKLLGVARRRAGNALDN